MQAKSKATLQPYGIEETQLNLCTSCLWPAYSREGCESAMWPILHQAGRGSRGYSLGRYLSVCGCSPAVSICI